MFSVFFAEMTMHAAIASLIVELVMIFFLGLGVYIWVLDERARRNRPTLRYRIRWMDAEGKPQQVEVDSIFHRDGGVAFYHPVNKVGMLVTGAYELEQHVVPKNPNP